MPEKGCSVPQPAEGHTCNPVACPTCRQDAQERDFHRIMDAASNVWAWVGPGYPDLDDLDERDLFMRDVSKLAVVFYGIQCGRKDRRNARD